MHQPRLKANERNHRRTRADTLAILRQISLTPATARTLSSLVMAQ